MRTMTRCFAAGAGAGALLLAGAASASAADAVHKPQTRNAVECGSAPGNATWNTICVSVVGFGQEVTRVQVSYEATAAPYFPATFCGVTAHVFGIYEDGEHYNAYGKSLCGDGEGTWTFSWPVQYAAFAPNSWLCGTVSWDGQSSDPNCVKIEPGN